MSIVDHNIEQDEKVKFIITSPHHKFRETLTIRQLLAAQPLEPQSHLQVYHYLYESSTSTRQKQKFIPTKLEVMLLDYIDVGHIQAAQEIIQTCLASGYCPSTTVVLVLMDSLLKRTKNKNKQERKEKVEQHYKSHALLLHTLKLFGPELLAPIWSKLGVTHSGRKRRRQYHRRQTTISNPTKSTDTTIHHGHNDGDTDDDNDDDDEEFEHGTRISRFEDFWHLASHCFTLPTNKLTLNNLGCRLALDVMIKLSTEDLRSRRDDKNTLSDCLLLSSIPLNSYGERSNFNRCLEVLFAGIKSNTSIPSTLPGTLQSQNMEDAMAILNQLILLSYCGQNLLKTTDLVEQTYRRILGLETSTLQHVMLCIQFPAFISSMCDIYFEDADHSQVPREHLVHRNRWGFSVDKMKNYILKTRPVQRKMTVANIMVHCLIVMWRWNAYLRTFSYRYDATTTTNVEVTRKKRDEKGISRDDLMQWKQHLLDMVPIHKDNKHSRLVAEISEIVEMMVLSIDI